MSYYGSWKIDDLLTFCANTHRIDTGAAADADSAPTYRVYEDETGTPILTGSMALLDSANTAGFYSEQITLSAANGFEKGKSYTVYIEATVNSVSGTIHHNFQVEAAVSANALTATAESDVRDAIGLPVANLNSLLSDIINALDSQSSAIDDLDDDIAALPAAVLDLANGIETGYTPRQALRLILSALAGKLSGAATSTVAIRNVTDAKTRITATVDADGNRSAVVVDAT